MKIFITLALAALALAGCATQAEQAAIDAAARDEAQVVGMATQACNAGDQQVCLALMQYRQQKAAQAQEVATQRRRAIAAAFAEAGDNMAAQSQYNRGFTCNTFGTQTTCR